MEAITIKWLLIGILIGVIIIAVSFAIIAITVVVGYYVLKDNQKGVVFQRYAEILLNNSKNAELIKYAQERAKSSPQDHKAYWYLGKAQYYMSDFFEAKRSFQKVIDLDPTMEYTTSQWIESIDSKLEDGPQLVK